MTCYLKEYDKISRCESKTECKFFVTWTKKFFSGLKPLTFLPCQSICTGFLIFHFIFRLDGFLKSQKFSLSFIKNIFLKISDFPLHNQALINHTECWEILCYVVPTSSSVQSGRCSAIIMIRSSFRTDIENTAILQNRNYKIKSGRCSAIIMIRSSFRTDIENTAILQNKNLWTDT